MAKLTFSGMAEFGRELDRLEQVAEHLESTTPTFDEMFPPAFMREYTRFSSWQELFRSGGFCVSTVDDLDNVSAQELDAFVSETTVFHGFQQMLDAGYSRYVSDCLCS